MKIFQNVLEAFITNRLYEEQHSYQFTELDLNEFLKAGLELSSTRSLQEPSCSLIIRRLLFNIDSCSLNRADHIKNLFQNLNNFDQQLCERQDPALIIQYEWLQGYVLSIPQDWLKLDRSGYQYLCDIHENNRWTLYIWSRIVHMSLLKSTHENPNQILATLNQWWKDVKHDIYNVNDALASILVIKIFEIIIVK
ncbi:unnamed protein product [Rotaria sp. Silwood2]|nr:unnamed protein product [Rotaria sp. Silwood2]